MNRAVFLNTGQESCDTISEVHDLTLNPKSEIDSIVGLCSDINNQNDSTLKDLTLRMKFQAIKLDEFTNTSNFCNNMNSADSNIVQKAYIV